MASASATCPVCGTQVDENSRFCGACGYAFTPSAGPAPAVNVTPDTASPKRQPARTMVGIASGGQLATMLGAAPPASSPSNPPSPSAPAPAAPAPSAPSAPSVQHDAPARHRAQTMMGVASPEFLAQLKSGTSSDSTHAPEPGAVHAPMQAQESTMLGMPKPERQRAQTVVAGSPPATMLGMPKASLPIDTGAKAKPNIDPRTDATMLGMAAAQQGISQAPAPVDVWAQQQSDPNLAPPPVKKNGPLLALFGLATLLLIAGGIGVVMLSSSKQAVVDVSVAQAEGGDELVVRVPGARAGTRVRFSGAEQALQNGSAKFALTADALHVGDNALSVDVIEADEDVSTAHVVVALDYRIVADLSGISESAPHIGFNIETRPGTGVTLDGEAVALDAAGHASKQYPVDMTRLSGGAFRVEAQYRVTLADGTVRTGKVNATAPVTSLQIERPGLTLTTDAASVEIAGVADPAATVTLDERPLSLQQGRFVQRVELTLNQERTFVVRASVRGKAPHSERIVVRRVADLAAEARRFDVDASLTYAKIQPNPAIYSGRGISLEGRVYNVELRDGRTTLQVLAKDCPRAQRCPVWVTYPAATEVAVDDWVSLIGRVDGEQQFRTETQQLRSVPRVAAAFVLRRRQ